MANIFYAAVRPAHRTHFCCKGRTKAESSFRSNTTGESRILVHRTSLKAIYTIPKSLDLRAVPKHAQKSPMDPEVSGLS